jgi:hypothetical protein
MKESKFIELLNLYIDHQIQPDDAALLEHEILQDANRRKIYSQYCRMHRACTMALNQSHAASESASAPAPVLAIETGSRARWGYYAAGLATAACLTVVVVHSAMQSGRGLAARPAATAPQAAALAGLTQAPATTPVRVEAPRQQLLTKTEGSLARELHLSGTADLSFFTSSNGDNATFTLPALSASATRPTIEDFVFAGDSATAGSPKIFRARQPGDQPEEKAAIEFQR